MKNKHRITIEIEYEVSNKYIMEHHGFYTLDKFLEAVKNMLHRVLEQKYKDDFIARITVAKDEPLNA